MKLAAALMNAAFTKLKSQQKFEGGITAIFNSEQVPKFLFKTSVTFPVSVQINVN